MPSAAAFHVNRQAGSGSTIMQLHERYLYCMAGSCKTGACVQHNELIRAGQWWRLITPTALHGNLLHLALNTLSLNSLGALTEDLSCHSRFLTIYAVSGIAGNLASFALCPSPAVGASGDALHGVQVLIHTMSALTQCFP